MTDLTLIAAGIAAVVTVVNTVAILIFGFLFNSRLEGVKAQLNAKFHAQTETVKHGVIRPVEDTLCAAAAIQKELGVIQGGLGLIQTAGYGILNLSWCHTGSPSISIAIPSSECRIMPVSHSDLENTTGTSTMPASKPASQAQSLT